MRARRILRCRQTKILFPSKHCARSSSRNTRLAFCDGPSIVLSGRCPSFADTVSEPKKTEINVGVRHDVPSVSTGCPAAIVAERRSTIVAVAVGVRRPFSPAIALYPVRRRNGGCQGVHVRGKYPPALVSPHTSGVASLVFDEYVSVHFRSKGYIHACICAPSVYRKRMCVCVCVCVQVRFPRTDRVSGVRFSRTDARRLRYQKIPVFTSVTWIIPMPLSSPAWRQLIY